MNTYRIYRRLKHFAFARHYKGHGIHSPFLYNFIENVLFGNSKIELITRIENHYWPKKTQFISTLEAINYNNFIVVIPISSSAYQYKLLKEWRQKNGFLTVSMKDYTIMFLDSKLPNQHFDIRR